VKKDIPDKKSKVPETLEASKPSQVQKQNPTLTVKAKVNSKPSLSQKQVSTSPIKKSAK